MVNRFLMAVFALCISLVTFVATPDADACGFAARRQARRQARFEFNPATEVQFSYQAVPVQTFQLVPVQTVQNVEVKSVQAAAKCANPDCKCGESCTCAEFALRTAKAAVSAPIQTFQSFGSETVCENGVCFRRPLLPRWRR